MTILSPLSGSLAPLGVGRLSLWDTEVDANTLILWRATSSAIVEDSPNGWSFTNSGCSISAAADGPFSNYHINVPSAADRLYTIADTDFDAGSPAFLDFWFRSNPSAPLGRYLFRVADGSGRPLFGVVVIAGSGSNIIFRANFFPTANTTPAYRANSPEVDDTGTPWHHVAIKIPTTAGNDATTAIGGVWGSAVTVSSLNWGTPARARLADYSADTSFAGYGDFDQVRLSTIDRWTPGTNFTPPTARL